MFDELDSGGFPLVAPRLLHFFSVLLDEKMDDVDEDEDEEERLLIFLL